MSVDVSFRGAMVESVELYLDKALVAKRQLMTPQNRGVLSFQVETLLLSEGEHEILVKAYGQDGKVTVTPGKVKIPAVDLDAPVRIAYPQNGFQVSGVIPIRVRLSGDLLRDKPYVTILIDKQVASYRNFAPYEYLWDTTRVTNGWHLLESWTHSASSDAVLKARPINVNVNNSGGATKKLDKIEDLRGPSKPDPLTGARTSAPEVVTGAAATAPQRVAQGDVPLRTAEPSSIGYGASTNPKVTTGATAGTLKTVRGANPQMMGGAVLQPKGTRGATSAPAPVLSALPIGSTMTTVVAPSRGNSSLITVQPGDTIRSIAERTGVNPREIARLNRIAQNSRPKAGRSLVLPGVGAFDVAFNGAPIFFDVSPRTVDGIRLAPFRQIFEHTGGKLYWFGGDAKLVRAINSAKEIEIRIGSEEATVNNRSLSLEKPAYIVSGRTIVPVSFMKDALELTVQYDPKSGRLLLESRK
jgi:LysM repeat protein